MPNQFDFCNQWAKSITDTSPSYQEFDTLLEESKKPYSNRIDGWSLMVDALEKKRLIYLWAKDKNNNPCLVILLGIQKIRDNKLVDQVKYENYVVIHGKDEHTPSFPDIKYKNNQFWFLEKNEKAHQKAKYSLIPEKLICGKEGISLPYCAHMTQNEVIKTIEKQVKEKKTLFSKTILENDFSFISSVSELFSLGEESKKYYPFLLGLFTDPRIYMRKKYLNELINNNPPTELINQLFLVASSECISGLFLALAQRQNKNFIDIALSYEETPASWADDMAEGLQRCATIYVASILPERQLEAERLVAENLSFIQFPTKENIIFRGRDWKPYGASINYRYYSYIFVNVADSSVFETSYFAKDTSIDTVHIKSFIQLVSSLDMVDALAHIAYSFDTVFTYYPISYNCSTKAFFSLQHQIFRAMDVFATNKPDLFIELMEKLLIKYNDLRHSEVLYVQGMTYYYFVMHFLFYHYEKELDMSDADSVVNALAGEKWMNLKTRQDRYPHVWNDHLDFVLRIMSQSTNTVILKGMILIAQDDINKTKVLQQSYDYFLNLLNKSNQELTAFSLSCIKQKVELEISFDAMLFKSLIMHDEPEIRIIAIQYMKKHNATLDMQEFVDIATTGLLSIADFDVLLACYSDEQFIDLILVLINKLDSKKNTTLTKEQTESIESGFSKLQEATNAQKIMIIEEIIRKIQTNINLSDNVMKFLEQVVFCFSWEDWQQILQSHDFAMDVIEILPEKNMRLLSLLQALRQNTIPKDAEINNILLYGSANMVRLLIDVITHNQDQLLGQSASMLIIFESSVVSLQDLAKTIFEAQSLEDQKRLLLLFIDSPFPHVYQYVLEQLEKIYDNGAIIPIDFMSKLLEHTADEVKKFVADKASFSLSGIENDFLLLYYIQSVLFSPNRLSKSKQQIYDEIPFIVERSPVLKEKMIKLLFSITDSTIRLDSDRAFVALAKIKARENSQCK